MRKDSARPTATIHAFPSRPNTGAKTPETAPGLAASRGGSVACFDSWYHDEAIQEDLPEPRRDPPARPLLRPV